MRRSLCSTLVALVLAACSADRTAILVEVTSSDLAVPDDVDALRFEARSALGGTIDRSFDIQGQWPHSLTIVPPEGERMGGITITVTGFHLGELVVRRVVTDAFEPGITKRITVHLSADCRGMICPEGIDCLAGTCVGSGTDGGMPDGGIEDDAGGIEDDAGGIEDDAGGIIDSGMRDSGMRDSGMRDSGVRDSGMPDAGSIFRCTGATCVGRIVISEVSSRGPASASDEFVELYNRSDAPVDVSGLQLRYVSSSGVTETGRGAIAAGTIMPAHSYLLLASAGYVGTPAGDPVLTPWTTGLADSGTVAIRAPDDTYVDLVAWGGATRSEGVAIVAEMPASGMGSFERKANVASTAATMSAGGSDALAGNGYDTDDNATNFVLRVARDPQSSASPTEP